MTKRRAFDNLLASTLDATQVRLVDTPPLMVADSIHWPDVLEAVLLYPTMRLIVPSEDRQPGSE